MKVHIFILLGQFLNKEANWYKKDGMKVCGYRKCSPKLSSLYFQSLKFFLLIPQNFESYLFSLKIFNRSLNSIIKSVRKHYVRCVAIRNIWAYECRKFYLNLFLILTLHVRYYKFFILYQLYWMMFIFINAICLFKCCNSSSA